MIHEILKDPNVKIIDVRTEGEFNEGHLENSENIPLDKIPQMVDDFKEMQKPIILCCRSGARSGQAVNYLKQNGVTDIYNGGGWTDVRLHTLK